MPKRMNRAKKYNGRVLIGGLFALLAGIVTFVETLHKHPEGLQDGSFVKLAVEALFVVAAACTLWGGGVMIFLGVASDAEVHADNSGVNG